MRFSPKGHLFETKGSVLFFNSEEMLIYVLGLVNSVVIYELLQVLCPTVDFHEGPIGKIPVLISHDDMDLVIRVVHQNIEASKQDWDSYETSWDFKQSLLVNGKNLTAAYTAWKQECEDRFQQLKKNEEELNRIFIDIYGLQDELTPDVADKDVTVHRVFDRKDDVPESMKGSNYVRTMRDEIVSLISYAVGCMFGRYSLDKPGLVLLGTAKSSRPPRRLTAMILSLRSSQSRTRTVLSPMAPIITRSIRLTTSLSRLTRTISSPSAMMTTSTMTSPDGL